VRPAVPSSRDLALGIDLGGTKILAACGREERILGRGKLKTRSAERPQMTGALVAADLA
jgi:N-acetylglucosamine kinase-like BadF-type ATPase